MERMFNNCCSLINLDLSSFNTQNVENMSHMFFHCSSLKELDLSNFEILKLRNMENMFSNCPALEKLNLSNFKWIINMKHYLLNTNNIKLVIVNDEKLRKDILSILALYNIPRDYKVCNSSYALKQNH